VHGTTDTDENSIQRRRTVLMRLGVLICFVGLNILCPSGQTSSELGAKYPELRAYEVRPGILMRAEYAVDGQVCRITLEKYHATSKGVDLDSVIPTELTEQLIDEVAPSTERGKRLDSFGKWGYESTISGNLLVKDASYENVSIEIAGTLSTCRSGDMVVTVRWRKRTCAAVGASSGATDSAGVQGATE
jgi:hypothetical protein